MILITGATGHVGSQVVAALLPAHAGQIRVLTRNPDAVFPDGTQKVVADLANSDLAPVLDDVHAMFLLTDGLNIADHDHRLVAAARLASVERIVDVASDAARAWSVLDEGVVPGAVSEAGLDGRAGVSGPGHRVGGNRVPSINQADRLWESFAESAPVPPLR